MGSSNDKKFHGLSTNMLILFSILAVVISGCDRGPKSQKAPTAPVTASTPAAPAGQKAATTPATPAAPAGSVDQQYVGKYIYEKNPQYFTELNNDGSFIIQQGNVNLAGKFTIKGKTLTLTTAGGALTGSIEGKTIIDNKGIKWIKS